MFVRLRIRWTEQILRPKKYTKTTIAASYKKKLKKSLVAADQETAVDKGIHKQPATEQVAAVVYARAVAGVPGSGFGVTVV